LARHQRILSPFGKQLNTSKLDDNEVIMADPVDSGDEVSFNAAFIGY
jgi:hypothetical protein